VLFIYIEISLDTEKLNWICEVGEKDLIIKKKQLEFNKNEGLSEEEDNIVLWK